MSEPVAVPVQDKPIEKREITPEIEGEILDDGLDLSGYRGTHGSPFVADFLGLRDLYKTNEEIKQNIDGITKHMIGKTEGQSIVYAVKDILKQYTDELNLKDNDSGIFKLKKITQLIQAKEKVHMLEKMRAQAISDIENMV